MKIAVIGAGMAGVAAAQALASDGHDVTVIERRSSVAEETSFAPAGIAASGLAAPWLPAPGRLQAMSGSADEASRLRGTGAAFTTPTLFGKGDGPDAGRRAERALALHKLLATGVERIDALAHALSLDFERGDGLLLALPDAATTAQAAGLVGAAGHRLQPAGRGQPGGGQAGRGDARGGEAGLLGDAGAPLDHRHRVAVDRERLGGRDAGHAGADHRDLHRDPSRRGAWRHEMTSEAADRVQDRVRPAILFGFFWVAIRWGCSQPHNPARRPVKTGSFPSERSQTREPGNQGVVVEQAGTRAG